MKYSRCLAIGLLVLLEVARVFAADITGTWKASFDTQIGQQNYTYQFVVKGTTLTGKIQSEMGGTTEVQQGKVEGDKVSFVEIFKFEGNEIQIIIALDGCVAICGKDDGWRESRDVVHAVRSSTPLEKS